MIRRKRYSNLLIAVSLVATGALMASRSLLAGETTVSTLAKQTHFHGISVDLNNPSRIYLATHHGLYGVAPDGSTSRISVNRDDFMGFTPHPVDPTLLYASGHPSTGGNLGFIASSDSGKSWTKLANGVGGPVDFHQMDVSKAEPKVIYGIHRGLQVSKDGGRSWKRVGPQPDGTIDIAASAKDANTVYAATKSGLLKSIDGGRSWAATYILRRPTTMVHVGGNATIYAFVIGKGLIRKSESALDWKSVGSSFAKSYMLHLAVDSGNEKKLYAITLNSQTRAQAIIASQDGGETWIALGGDANRAREQ